MIRTDDAVDAAAPAWQRGYQIETLRSIRALFTAHDGGLPLSPFTAVRETQVAEWLQRRQLCLRRGTDGELVAAMVVTRSASRRRVVDFAGHTRAHIPPSARCVTRMAAAPGYEDVLLHMAREAAPTHAEVWQEHPVERAVVDALGFNQLAVKVRASSELRGVYGAQPAVPYLVEQWATLSRLPVDSTVLRPQVAALSDELRALEAAGGLASYADHYSSYNRGHAWAALSLRGYSDDTTFIIKPAEMSRAWQKEHADACAAPLRDTALRGALPAVEPILAALPGPPHRIRLMLLQPGGGELTRHADITDPDAGVDPGQTLRIHVPLATNPDVRFTMWQLDGTRIAGHMQVGTAWYLDTRKPHTAVNGGATPRLHLVADIESTPAVLELLRAATSAPPAPPQ